MYNTITDIKLYSNKLTNVDKIILWDIILNIQCIDIISKL